MSNIITETQNIITENIKEDIWNLQDKGGWSNKCIFKNLKVDPHAVSIRLGQSMENILTAITEKRYPGERVPRFLAGHDVSKEEAEEYWNKKYATKKRMQRKNAVTILTRFNQAKVKTAVENEYNEFLALSKKKRIRFSHKIMKEISQRIIRTVPPQKKIWQIGVDLCPRIGNTWSLTEIKMSGNVDGGKGGKIGPLFCNSMLLPYVCLGDKPKRVYFGIVSNNLGLTKEGEWRGPLSSIVEPEMILIEDQIFDLIAPKGLKFNKFTSLIIQRLDSLRPKY